MSTDPTGASYPTAARIGRWIIPGVPSGWTWIHGFGIQKQLPGTVPSNVFLKEDQLLAGNLELYIRAQVTLLRRTFLEPKIAGPAPIAFPDAEEAAMLMVKHQPLNEITVLQVQHYLRRGGWIGIATLTTVEPELLKVRPDFEQFMKLLRIEP